VDEFGGDTVMADLNQIGRLIIDLDPVDEIIDEGDYVFVAFHLHHRPPYLYLTGNEAAAMRTWLAIDDDHPALTDKDKQKRTIGRFLASELERIEQLALVGESLVPERVLQLVTALRVLREDREQLVQYNIWRLNMLLSDYEKLRREQDSSYSSDTNTSALCTICQEYLDAEGWCTCNRPSKVDEGDDVEIPF
jgi:hypothetical protein